MKTTTVYTITIETETIKPNSFIEELTAEVKQEHKELELTHAINKESSEILRVEFYKFIHNVIELSGGYIKLEAIRSGASTNNFIPLHAWLSVGHKTLKIYANATNEKFEGTRYRTFTGFEVDILGSSGLYFKTDINDILAHFKDAIKCEISKTL